MTTELAELPEEEWENWCADFDEHDVLDAGTGTPRYLMDRVAPMPPMLHSMLYGPSGIAAPFQMQGVRARLANPTQTDAIMSSLVASRSGRVLPATRRLVRNFNAAMRDFTFTATLVEGTIRGSTLSAHTMLQACGLRPIPDSPRTFAMTDDGKIEAIHHFSRLIPLHG